MSVARGFGINGLHYHSNVSYPTFINLQFKVDSSNANGLGVSSVKSNGFVRNVFMHTSASPGQGDGLVNPNPLAGFALIQFKNNFNFFLNAFAGFISPDSGSDLAVTSGLTLGQAYVISVLGTTTLAEWQAIGVPVGVVPAVNVSFIAIATGTGGAHTGKVQIPVASGSGALVMDVIGDPIQSNNSLISANGGDWLLVRFLGATSSSVTSLVATAPADKSICFMEIGYDRGSVTVDGI